MSKKKIILITVISILVIALIAGIIIYMVVSNGLSATPIIEIVNDKLMNSDKYVFETTYNDENRTYLAKSGETAYVDSFYDGIESKYVVRDGNTYLLIDDAKTYYTYENNTTDLTRITSQFTSLSEQEPTRGKEKIDGKEYNYDEYVGSTDFLIQDLLGDGEIDESTVRTRFYYKGQDLLYIKTIVGEQEELLKVNISYNVDENLFNIPTDYQEA